MGGHGASSYSRSVSGRANAYYEEFRERANELADIADDARFADDVPRMGKQQKASYNADVKAMEKASHELSAAINNMRFYTDEYVKWKTGQTERLPDEALEARNWALKRLSYWKNMIPGRKASMEQIKEDARKKRF